MCTADGGGCALAAPGGGFASMADALRVGDAVARYLNSPAAADLEGAARGEALEALGAITSLLGAAANGLLRRFDADDGHDADGYASAAAWLAAKNHLGRKDAKAAVRQMRLLARHPLLDAATAAGAITVSWAKEIAAWTGRIDHEELQAEADRILLDAAAAGRGPGRPEDPRAGRLRGLARPGARPRRRPPRPRVRRPVPAPGHHPRRRRAGQRGPDPGVRRGGHRGAGGAGQEPRPGGHAHRRAALPRRPPGRLRAAHPRQDGARPGGSRHPRRRDHPPVRPPGDGRRVRHRGHLAPRPRRRARLPGGQRRRGDRVRRPPRPGRDRQPRLGADQPDHHPGRRRLRARRRRPARAARPAQPQPPPLPPGQWQDLQYALARLAISFVSGPGAVASALRRGLLGAPLNGKSVILDVGYADTIPESIRRAVIARDKGCAWPGGCDRRPAACDVHHVKHKKHGGKTSTTDCVMLCQYHHDICVHRLGWEIELLPDGSTRATSPDRQTVLRSHGPPPTTQPSS